MKNSDAVGNPEMEMLRNILLGEERRDLDDIRKQLAQAQSDAEAAHAELSDLTQLTERLQARADDPAAFLDATAKVLPDALNRAGKQEPVAVSRALSPFVVTSIRQEIANSRDDMVDALYPITGRLVAASVRNAITKLSEDINERMNALTSTAVWNARIKAWRTGEPISKFLITSGDQFHVRRAMLLDRGSGTPKSVAEADDVSERSDTNLISGLLAALSNLTQEVYTSAADELRRVDLNGRQIAFRRSASQLLVVEFIGRLPADVQSEIDRRFADIVSYSEQADQDALDTAVTALLSLEKRESAGRDESSPKLWKWFLGGLIVLAFGWVVGTSIGRWQLDRTVDKVQAVIDADSALAAFPITVTPDYETNVLTVRGLIPRTVSAASLRQLLLHAGGAVDVQVALQSVVDQQMALRTESEVAELRAENGELRRSLAAVRSHLDSEQMQSLPENLRVVDERLDRFDAVFEIPNQKLRQALSGTVIRFDHQVELYDGAAADAAFKRIASLLLASPELLLVTAHTDPAIANSEQWALAQARYVRTQLLRYGVSASQLRIALTEQPSKSLANAVVFSAGDGGTE